MRAALHAESVDRGAVGCNVENALISELPASHVEKVLLMTGTPPSQPPQWGPRPEGPSPPASGAKMKRPRRIFLWIFLLVQLLFVIWIITGVNAASDDPSCEGLTGEDLRICEEAGDVGTALGVGLIIALWAAVDIILGITYGIYRLSRRPRS
ncbi:hypothetical protein [Streptomyces sp. TRM68367]|uniref:hypothetical protein n=1 Tax=Streptomyces sp. TRM68367 TaxID=2758415 RepID=UPI00165B0B27|nr:hypothetical protein [Streptomyces sp. TRM68367]MBC9728819.1 hypothetical protein [Streptomyces sp. TRM68367]